ncbi:MAG TPA: LuxR family transcriptional regulator [Acidimicrobiia bacterium]|nr:LuxR family transcriptional regulator [Acidimicrobiia bacterium]
MQVLCPTLVGRDAELSRLDASLTGALDGRGGCVVLSGEPGIGKSRLVRELTARAAAHGVPTVCGRAVPSSTSVPYRPLTEALLQLLRDRDLPDDERFAPWRGALGALLPGVAETETATATSPAIRGEALVQLLRRVAPDGLVVVLEDLHWADRDTVAVLEYLADNLTSERVLCAMTLRDAPESPALELLRRLRGRAGVVHLALERLDAQAMAAMAAACVPDAPHEVITHVQRTAEGVPLLVEELLASPGLPQSFAETVRERLADLTPDARAVVEAAAVLGRDFDWELLPAVTGASVDTVCDALARAHDRLLLTSDGLSYRFRHALTREAVLDGMLPPAHRAVAAAALAAVDTAHPALDGSWREVAADLAERAGDRPRAGALLAETGREALDWGALATAIDALRRAVELQRETQATRSEVLLVEALALAGRADEASAAGGQLIARLRDDPETEPTRVEVYLRLAQAAVAASRWPTARNQLDAARALCRDRPAPAVRPRIDVLEAEIAFAADDLDAARRLAEDALGARDVSADVRCHALEIVGRSHRFDDLVAARDAFERALATAEAANLPVWRLRALHELGTIDLFDHAGIARLSDARRAAEQMGALSTAAVLDLQLAAAFTCRWDLDACDDHARAAIAIAERLALDIVRSKALAMLAGSASMRADVAETERYVTLMTSAAPEDRMLEGFGSGARGTVALLRGDTEEALALFGRGMGVLARLPHAEPAAIRALWPVLLASVGDRRAQPAIDEARRLGVAAFHLNRGLIAYAEAILAGRAGQGRRADELVADADRAFRNCEAWAELARLLAAEAALADGWGDPERWLTAAAAHFAERGLPWPAQRCRELLASTRANPWAGNGITAREADVLRLVIEGLANKEIAAELRVSPRTVEKHVESLLRKTGARSRTELAVASASPARRRNS